MGAPQARATPVLTVDAKGILHGASGVVVDGQTYDVEFKHGSCSTVFPDLCVSGSLGSFVFSSKADATGASQALITQLPIADFTNPGLSGVPSSIQTAPAPGGPITSNVVLFTSLIAGCTATVNLVLGPQCQIATPYAHDSNSVSFAAAVQGISIYGRPNGVIDPTTGLDAAQPPYQTWAVWTLESTAVPEPATMTLLGAGALGLGTVRATRKSASRRRRQSASPDQSRAVSSRHQSGDAS